MSEDRLQNSSFRQAQRLPFCRADLIVEADLVSFAPHRQILSRHYHASPRPHSDLARFISAGRLNCSIDKVNGIVETNRPDLKNARYEQTIKQGDVLLNSLQKLSRVIG